MRLNHPALVTADILPLFVKLDALARKIAEVLVHVIGERFPSFADDAQNGILARLEHSADRVDRSSLAERAEN